MEQQQQQPYTSLDCPNGLTCSDYECELRHHDVEEQQLRRSAAGTSTSANTCSSSNMEAHPKVIITASRDMGRSASTWVFNAVRLLLLHAGVWCDSYWIRNLTAEKIQERIQALAVEAVPEEQPSPPVVLIKTHEYYNSNNHDDVFQQQIRPLLSHIIVSVRQGFPPDPFWVAQATYMVAHEDIVVENPTYDPTAGAMSVLQQLAQHMGIPSLLTYEQLCHVDYQLMTLPIPGDQSTKFWPFHGRRGGRRAVPKPPPPTSKRVQQHHIFVTRHGARQDNGPDRNHQWLTQVGHGRPQDAPLSAHGHQAAQEMAQAMRKYYDNDQQQQQQNSLFFIVSSPLLRCMETAQAVSKVWKVPIYVEPGIAEVGTRPSHTGSLEELQQERGFNIDVTYKPILPAQKLPRSEYGDGAAARRAASVARRVVERILANNHDESSINVLFVGHGATCLGLVSAFGAPQDYVGYCSLTHFQQQPGDDDDKSANKKSWSLVGTLGDVAHLSDQATALDSAW